MSGAGFAYVGCFTTERRHARGDGIHVYAVISGVWTHVQHVPGLINPSFLIMGEDGRTLYAVHGDQDYATAFARDAGTGQLQTLGQAATGGDNVVHGALDPGARHFVAANYGTGSVAVLPVADNGGLAGYARRIAMPGTPGPHRTEQAGSHPHQIVFDPSGRFVVVPDKGHDSVAVFAQNPDAWFQAYLPGDQLRIDRLVDRVAAAGFGTLVVTADTPVLGNREHNTRSGFSMPIRVTPKVAWQSAIHPRWLLGTVARTFYRHGPPHFENMEADRGPPMLSRNALRNTTARDKLSWTNLEAIRRRWKGTLLVKGLTAPADAAIARESGADGVILSNHGGRQLDYDVSPLDALPEVAAQKGGMVVIVDSGVRRGTDVLKALALGADFVFLGRPFLFAAAIGGVPGIVHAARILKEKVERNMALLGVTRLSQLTPDLLRPVSNPA